MAEEFLLIRDDQHFLKETAEDRMDSFDDGNTTDLNEGLVFSHACALAARKDDAGYGCSFNHNV